MQRLKSQTENRAEIDFLMHLMLEPKLEPLSRWKRFVSRIFRISNVFVLLLHFAYAQSVVIWKLIGTFYKFSFFFQAEFVSTLFWRISRVDLDLFGYWEFFVCKFSFNYWWQLLRLYNNQGYSLVEHYGVLRLYIRRT